MAVGDVYQMSAFCRTQNQQNQVNVTHWRHEANISGGLGLQQIADKLSALWGEKIIQLLPPTTTFQGIKFRRVFPNPTNVLQSELGSGEGALGSSALPSSAAFLISCRASTAPVFVRGRISLPSPDETSNDSPGIPSVGYRGAVITAFDTILQDDVDLTEGGDGVTVRYGIYRRNHSPVFYPVDNVLYRREWSAQIRRRGTSRPDVAAF